MNERKELMKGQRVQESSCGLALAFLLLIVVDVTFSFFGDLHEQACTVRVIVGFLLLPRAPQR